MTDLRNVFLGNSRSDQIGRAGVEGVGGGERRGEGIGGEGGEGEGEEVELLIEEWLLKVRTH